MQVDFVELKTAPSHVVEAILHRIHDWVAGLSLAAHQRTSIHQPLQDHDQIGVVDILLSGSEMVSDLIDSGPTARPLPVLPAHSVVHLARHDHGLELLKILRISTPTP
jgi:hypothetical protein